MRTRRQCALRLPYLARCRLPWARGGLRCSATCWSLARQPSDFTANSPSRSPAQRLIASSLSGGLLGLYDVLPDPSRGGLWPTADEAIPELLRFLRAGDVVTVKGSRGIGLGFIVERLRAESARTET